MPDLSAPSGLDGVTFTLSYVWGNNGRLAEATDSESSTTETIHWDGDHVLFTTNTSGAVDDIKFGSRGPLGIAGNLTFSGSTAVVNWGLRDFSGSPIGAEPPSSSRQLCSQTTGMPIFYPGPDGISDGVNVFQGVRSYDPVIGAWNSPDAYQGDVGDPMSQKAYMWDGNNSFIYSDPSGYDALIDIQPRAVYGLGHIQIITYNPRTNNGTVLSVQSSNGRAFGPMHVTQKPVGDVRQLSTHGNMYFHITTTQRQNNLIRSAYSQAQTAAAHGARYNIIDNNCETTLQSALHHAGTGIQLDRVPTSNQYTLPVQGRCKLTRRRCHRRRRLTHLPSGHRSV